jgi:hypothetical protein
MLFDSRSNPIHSIADWRRLAPPKHDSQWVEGRSAFELARAWTGGGSPAVPSELTALLASRTATRGLVVERAVPELRIRFDTHPGEPRNADLALLGHVGAHKVGVTVEAKADEPFGATVEATSKAARKRLAGNPRSRGLQRLDDLVRALLPPRGPGQPGVDTLRYQLLTAVAGTLAFAHQHAAETAVLVIHEFVTDRTSDGRHRANARDLTAFVHRLSGVPAPAPLTGTLQGPFTVPGIPLFPRASSLLIGKIVTRRR